MNCINYSSQEYQSLLSDSGLTKMELDAKILEHQEDNNTDTYPLLENVKIQIEEQSNIQRDAEITSVLKQNDLITLDSTIAHGLFLKPNKNIITQVNQIKEIANDRDVVFTKDAFVTEAILTVKTDSLPRDRRIISPTMFQNIISEMSSIVPGIYSTPLSSFNYISLGEQYGVDVNNTPAFVLGDTIFFNTEDSYLTSEIALEEALHPLVLGINKTDQTLFNDLFEESKQNYSKLWFDIKSTYKQNQSLELVTQVLAREFNNIDNIKTSQNVFLRALEVIKSFFNRMFNYNSKNVSNSPKIALKQLIEDLNTKSNIYTPYYTSEFIQNSVKIYKNSEYKNVTISAAKDVQDALTIRLRRLQRNVRVSREQLFELDKFIKSISDGRINDRIFQVAQQQKYTEDTLNLLRSEIALVGFIDQLDKDIVANNNKLLNAINDEKTVGYSNISIEVLNDLKENFIDFYKQIINSTKDALYADGNSFLEYSNFIALEKGKNSNIDAVRRLYEGKLKKSIADFEMLEYNYKRVRFSVLERDLSQNLNEMSAPQEIIDTVIQELDSVGYDSHSIAQYMASTNYVKDNLVRLMSYYITVAKEKVSQKVQDKLNLIERTRNNLSFSDRYNIDQILSEYDRNGKKTGNWVTSLNHGQSKKDYDQSYSKLLIKYGIDDKFNINDVTFTDKRSDFLKERNKLQHQFYQKRYSQDFYDLQAELMPEAIDAKAQIDEQILILLDTVTDNEGVAHTERMSIRQVDRYEQLKRNKRNLSNIYDDNGEMKSGIELEIAKNIQAYNESLRDKFKNIQRTKEFLIKWQQLRDNVTKNVQGAEAALYNWERTNVVTRYDDKFWESLQSISSTDYGDKYAQLQDRRSKLFRLYRHTYDLEIDVDQINNNLREEIKTIDIEMYNIRTNNDKVKSNFSKVAEMAESDDYKAARARYKENTPEFAQWFNENHYPITVRNQVRYVPYSYWLYMRPTNTNFIHQEPSNLWSDISNESAFANPNFNENDSHYGLMPRIDKYDNSVALKRITDNLDYLNLYNLLRDIMKESQNLQTFRKTENNLMLPQIVGKFGSKWKSEDSFFNKIKYILREAFTINEDDEGYNTVKDENRFKSERNNRTIPVYYNRPLQNPDSLTKDLIGSVLSYYKTSANFDEMSRVLPKLKLMLEQIEDRKIEIPRKKSILRKDSEKSNTYNVAKNLLDNHVFMNRQNVSFAIPNRIGIPFTNRTIRFGDWLSNIDNSETRLSLNKLLSAMRSFFVSNNLSFKLPAIFSDFVAAQTDLEVEGLVGRYIDGKLLGKGKLEMLKAIPSWISDAGSNIKHSKLVSLMQLNEMSFDRSSQTTDLHVTGFGANKFRAFKQNALFFGWNVSDFLVKSQITAAVYMNHKLVNGELIDKQTYARKYHNGNKELTDKAWNNEGETLYDNIQNNNGQLVVTNPNFNEAYNDQVRLYIKGVLQKVMSEIDGQMRETDKAKLHANIWGSFFTMHRGFMIMNYYKQFKPRQYDFFSQREEMGNVRGLANLINQVGILDLLKGLFNKSIRQSITNENSEYLINSLRYVTRSVAFIFTAWLTSMFYFQSNADDEPNNADAQLAALLASRTLFEMSSKYSIMEVMGLIQSPTAALGYVETFYMFDNLFNSDVVESGLYQGLSKRERQLIKLTPYRNIFEIKEHNAQYYRKKNDWLYGNNPFLNTIEILRGDEESFN